MKDISADLLKRAAAIRLLVSDVDGVLTDGSLYFGAQGEQLKVFHVHDGYGLRQVQKAGIEIAIISGRHSEAVVQRMQELGIRNVHLGCSDKAPLLRDLMATVGVAGHEVAVIGDDIPDLQMFELAGLTVAVADAHAHVRDAAHWQTSKRGGRGAVRELCDLLLQAQGTSVDTA